METFIAAQPGQCEAKKAARELFPTSLLEPETVIIFRSGFSG